MIWLASYPKSGSTWLRLFLARLLHLSEPFSLASAYHIPYASERTHADAPVRKIHDAWTPIVAPPETTRAAIYLVRDPRDVAVSLAAHAGASVAEGARWINRPGGVVAWSEGMPPMRVGSWSEHVRSWCESAPFPVVRLRYEELLADPLPGFRAVADLVRPGTSDADMIAAANAVQFEQLQALEARDGFDEAPPGRRFFRAGQREQWRAVLSRDVLYAIECAHAVSMAACGYTDVTHSHSHEKERE
jgi:hypothetical protein